MDTARMLADIVTPAMVGRMTPTPRPEAGKPLPVRSNWSTALSAHHGGRFSQSQ